MHPSRVYLTGFMGSGKSTVGPILANVLGLRAFDLDVDVARRAGAPVAAFFAAHGEPAFRALEADALRATAALDGVVVATGGGALAREPNLSWALDHGTVVYLRLPAAALADRLARSRNVRPLLLGPDGERLSADALLARVAALLEAREPFYLRAHAIVDADLRSIGLTVDAAARAVERFWARAARASVNQSR